MRGIRTVTAAALFVLVFALGMGNTPARAGLRAAWSFEESDGANVYDSSGNHNIGIIRGDPMGNFNLWVSRADFERCEGQTGKALYLKNKSFIEILDTDDLRLNGCLTIEGRFLYGTNSNAKVLFYKGLGGLGGYYHNYSAAISAGKIKFSCTDINGIVHSISAKVPPAGEWHLLDFVYNGKELLIYIDKTLAVSREIGKVRFMTEFSQGLLIGAQYADYLPFHRLSSVLEGGVDEFRIYDEALTPERMGQPLAKRAEVPKLASERESGIQRILRQVGLKRERLTVTKDGRAAAAIVIRKGYTGLQSAPAKELQKYIEKFTGARLPILEDDSVYSGNMILVGKSRYTQELGIETGKMQGDSYVMRSFPRRLVLAGHDETLDVSKAEYEIGLRESYNLALKTVKNGTLNAVYAFLQDYCGVRWFMPGDLWEHIPERHDLEVSGLNVADQPYRGYMLNDRIFTFYKSWNDRNFIGESANIFAFDAPHNWGMLVPDRHYESHPEWFAMRNGKRIKGSLCTSNRTMWEVALKNLKLIYSQGFEIVNLLQVDGYGRCQCPACDAMDNYRGDPYYVPEVSADRIWIFHDYLAREIQKTYPDRKLSIYSYGPTAELPDRNKIPELPDNVIIEQCQNNTILDRALLERWRKYHPAPYSSFFVFWFLYENCDYLPQSYDYIANELKTLIFSYGGRSFFLCGGGNIWNLNAPIYYMMARLLRNPNQDPKAILDEFCAGLFGKASGSMRAYFTTLYNGRQRQLEYALAKQKVQRTNAGAGEPVIGQSIPIIDRYMTVYPEEITNACERHLNQAWELADNETIKKRIEFFADAFVAQKLTTQGFKRMKESEAADWSKETFQQLVQTVNQRNKFIEDTYKRRQRKRDDEIISERYPGVADGFEVFRVLKNVSTNYIDADDGNRVAVVMGGAGADGIAAALTNSNQKFLPIFAPVVKNPVRHPALIIAQPTQQIEAYNDSIPQLRDYVNNGGAVMLTHDTVGYRKFKAAFPEIGKGVKAGFDANAVIVANHEITSDMKTGDSFKHAYCDHIILEKGPQGTVVCADTNGQSVMVAGSFGKGKVILNGMIPGHACVKERDYNGKDKEPEGMERQLLLNAVNWLKAR